LKDTHSAATFKSLTSSPKQVKVLNFCGHG